MAEVKGPVLDEEFQKNLAEISQAPRVAYLTVGHGELNDRNDKDVAPTGHGVWILRKLLESQKEVAAIVGVSRSGMRTDTGQPACAMASPDASADLVRVNYDAPAPSQAHVRTDPAEARQTLEAPQLGPLAQSAQQEPQGGPSPEGPAALVGFAAGVETRPVNWATARPRTVPCLSLLPALPMLSQ